ncbi:MULTISPECIES: hypothetical protein [unclassified Pseudomonas]|uniref:hypothetical protein n=1 Tax=unclassified Pseudomonas TaxID=196821 RepID=UPI000BD885AB|nr:MULTISPECIES: hypothetical protein [unclassified Pseudomonas]PVZ20139.1 hypothetical protein F474_00732 [Pseudomonas sp. URIL14HWK12:I12]PVZ27205.1 hypothetical protein F470_00387 [Pseudomonas sp. URIL14HWK12:I10]PVZ38094.1 hypothetical protein F472_00732 [Pseudomonas sp. URIL14HWK12:I11]SNZ04578.1 hypothetical protein SAMN05660463_00672 [Pseudomonas sp. URIL14HWK12:I9]
MGRQVLMYLSHAVKRIVEGFTPQARDDAHETQRTSLASVLMIVGLSLYIAGGLGYYAKAHLWDVLTEQQKAIVVQAMMTNDQML